MNWKLVSGVLALAVAFLLYKQRKASSAATTTAKNTNTNTAADRAATTDPIAALLESEGF